jgi:hypothetical protein
LIRRAKRQAELMGHHLEGVESDRTRSDLETLFLGLCARYDIPSPEVNVRVGRWEVDFLWRSQRLVVETDHWTYHRGSVAFEDDHARDLDLRVAGYTERRFTDRQLETNPSGWWRTSAPPFCHGKEVQIPGRRRSQRRRPLLYPAAE